MAEKRLYPRITGSFPIKITPDFLGNTVNLSESGLSFVLDKPLLISRAQAKIELSPEEFFDTEFKVIWNRHLIKEGKFTYGACFINLTEKNIEILRKVMSVTNNLNIEFVGLTHDFRDYLQDLKTKFDNLDDKNLEPKKRINFLESEKEKIFKKFDFYFNKTWEIIKDFEREKYIAHQNYYYKILSPLLGDIIEINRYIYTKPLGYSGDYIMMNYIYDYSGNNHYLGGSSFEKLINNYTCNIPISVSNIRRKEFLKEKIIATLKKKENAKILSIASGPARELTELLREGKFNKSLLFICLDFEKKALDYVNKEISKIEFKRRQSVTVEYIHRDIISIIRDKKLREVLKDCNLIYAFGIFDYLTERMVSRLAKELYQLLQNEGELIICNASLENSSHRAYYELLGKWNMAHRTKKQMLDWMNGIEDIKEIKFEEPIRSGNYLFLSIRKK